MIKIGNSACHCGFCGAAFDVEWEVDTTLSYDHDYGMGEEVEYVCVAETVCPKCYREIVGHMNVSEYPVGVLDMVSKVKTDDGRTKMEKPVVEFFDL